jgi:hypothetical protein
LNSGVNEFTIIPGELAPPGEIIVGGVTATVLAELPFCDELVTGVGEVEPLET